MLERRLAGWLRPVLSLLSLAALLALGGCGGGGGAVNDPSPPTTPQVTPIVILPAGGTAYSGVPFVLTISGGVPPYTAVSSNPAILPATQNVSGNSLVLVPANVGDDTPVNITIRDAVAQAATVAVLVRPSLLLPASITITGSPACTGGGQLCSGTTGTARVRVTGPGGAGIAGRSVRFEVVQGNFQLVSTNPAQPLVSTLTVVTDINGDATIVLSVPANAVSQLGVLRAVETTTGSQVTGQFTIVQQIAGTAILSVIPNGTTTITGPFENECSSGVLVRHYIFGGQPPYQVSPSFPQAVTLVGSPVQVQGGSFDVITNGSCFENMTFAIVDANGVTVTDPPRVTNEDGENPRPAPTPAPATLGVSPSNYTIAAPSSCAGRTFSFTVTGQQPFSASAVTIPVPATPAVLNATLSASPGTLLVSSVPSGTTTITFGDANNPQQLRTATIVCP
jgi:hypothetical protein